MYKKPEHDKLMDIKSEYYEQKRKLKEKRNQEITTRDYAGILTAMFTVFSGMAGYMNYQHYHQYKDLNLTTAGLTVCALALTIICGTVSCGSHKDKKQTEKKIGDLEKKIKELG